MRPRTIRQTPAPAPSTVNNKLFTMAIFVFWPYFAPEKTPLFTKTCRSLFAFYGWQMD